MGRKQIIFLFFLTITIQLFANVTFTHDTDVEFNQAYLQNAFVSGQDVTLPQQATSLSSWISTTNLPIALQDHEIVYWNNYIYLVGGYDGTACSDAVYRASIGSTIGSWTQLTSLPIALRDHQVVVAHGYIYVLGGYNDGTPFDEIYKADLNEDGTIGDWELSSVSLPQGLSSHTAEFLAGYIYVIGGTTASDDAITAVYRANIGPEGVLGNFSTTTSLPDARSHHSVVSYGDKLYVIGGIDNSSVKQNTVYYSTSDFDGNLSSWSSATALPAALMDHTTTCFNGIITVLGGDTGTISNDCYFTNVHDSPSFTWDTTAPHYPLYVSGGEAVAVNDRIFVLGGYNNVSESLLDNAYYSNLTLDTELAEEGIYVSNVMNFGYEKTIEDLTYLMYNYSTNYFDIYYRLAGEDEVWGSWIDNDQTNPVNIGQDEKYLQYMFHWHTGTGIHNVYLSSVSVEISGYTEKNMNVSGTVTWNQANSPYWVTSDITIQNGTLTIEPGVEILFSGGTGITIDQAELYCVGTSTDSIVFTSFDHQPGTWDGLYFNDNSDDGVASTMEYVKIKNAGYDSRNANIYCVNTTQPNISYSSLESADGHGLRLNNSDVTADHCEFVDNLECGVYVHASDPILTNCSSYNNVIGLGFSGPDYQAYSGLNIYGNSVAAIAMEGGTISNDRNWPYFAGDIAILGNVYVQKSYNKCRLTIAAGNSIVFPEDVHLYIGDNSNDGGELYAEGTPDSIITFSSTVDTPGGWGGIVFRNASDYSGATNSLKNCVIENGDTYNLYLENTNSVTIDSCLVRNSAGYGIQTYSSYLSISNTEITYNQDYPFYTNGPMYVPEMINVDINGNSIDCVATDGGTITSDRRWRYCGAYYKLLGNLNVDLGYSTCRLTLDPGVTLKFGEGFGFTIGDSGNDGGELYAEGTADSVITITSDDASDSGWNGLYFNNASDYSGSTSLLTHCVIENGVNYNVYFNSTNSITLQDCEIRNSDGNGIYSINSFVTLKNLQIDNNDGYPIHFNNPHYVPEIENITTSGNTNEFIAVDGGTISTDRTWVYCSTPYLLLGNLYIQKVNNSCILTVEPGTILKFSDDCQLRFGDSGNDAGGISALGTIDSLITFTSANDSIGGWDGIYFNSGSDYYGTYSYFKYCTIEHSSDDNIYFNAANNDTLDNCIIQSATDNGIRVDNSDVHLSNVTFQNNGKYGLHYEQFHRIQDDVSSLTFTGNYNNAIALGSDTYSSYTYLPYHNFGYEILGDVSYEHTNGVNACLEIAAGNTLKFDLEAQLKIADDSNDGGKLIAEGTIDSVITFTSVNDSIGGWDGIYFDDGSDYGSLYSILSYCVIENSSDDNLYFNTSSNHELDNCVIRNAVQNGINAHNSYVYMSDLQINNNGNYPLIINNPYYLTEIENVTTSGNGNEFLAIGSGTISNDRTWSYCATPYLLQGNLHIEKTNNNCLLTLNPGITLKFTTGSQLSLGDSGDDGGSIYALGTPDSLITFTAANDSIGGWNGIHFNAGSDAHGGNSIFSNCLIEKSGDDNIYIYGNNNCSIDSCLTRNAVNNGIRISNSNVTLSNITFQDNGIYGLCYEQFANFQEDISTYTFIGNGYNAIALGGDYVTGERNLPFHTHGYVILDDVVFQHDGGTNSSLDIAAGNTIKFDIGARLQIGDDSNDGGSLTAIGKADSIITFTALNDSIGGWDGVYFATGSDYSISASNLEYCYFSKASEYNVCCQNTNDISFDNCEFDSAEHYGFKIYNANISVDNSSLEYNDVGLYNYAAVPNLENVTIQNNLTAGIESGNEPPIISNSTIQNNNGFELDIFQANGYPVFTNTTITGNGSLIRIDSGTIHTYDRIWLNHGEDYHILGDVYVYQNAQVIELTVESGIDLKFEQGAHLQLGNDANDGGRLFAEGTLADPITFTALNDSIGGWEGILFENGSDYGSSTKSILEYCNITKANSYNVRCSNTDSVYIDQVEMNSALGKGLELNNAGVTIENSTLEYNDVGLYSHSSLAQLDNVIIQDNLTTGIESGNLPATIINSTVQNNNGHELKIYQANGYPIFQNTDVLSNGSIVEIGSGTIYGYDRRWLNCGCDYNITGDVNVYQDVNVIILTIEAGITMNFAGGTGLQIGNDGNDGGRLIAEGTPAENIDFTSQSGATGGWEGILFENGSDYGSPTTSILEYCNITKANSYNVKCTNTDSVYINQVVLDYATGNGLELNDAEITVENATIENNDVGLYSHSSMPELNNVIIQNNTTTGIESGYQPPFINNSTIQNNNVHELKIYQANGYPVFTNTTITGNGSDVRIADGVITNYDRTWLNHGGDYFITGDVRVYQDASITDLAIEAGLNIKFSPGTELQIGNDANDGGSLNAVGTPDSLITFTAVGDTIGGWDGIYFTTGSDYSDASSFMKYCVVQKASDANIYINGSDELVLDHVNLLYSQFYGLHCNVASPTLKISRVTNNESYGIYIQNNSSPLIGHDPALTCDLYNNGTYDVYNDYGNTISCTHNFWNTTDTTFINTRIYDQLDDGSKGLVNYQPADPYSLYGNQPPEDFALVYPADNGVVSVENPTFIWESSSDPEGGAVTYQLLYTQDSTWATYDLSPVISDTTYTISEDLTGISYFWWKVRAKDDLITIYSDETFKFAVSFQPTVPDPIIPLTGDYMTADNYLIWLAASDPDNGDAVAGYHIQIDEDANFGSPEVDTNLSVNSDMLETPDLQLDKVKPVLKDDRSAEPRDNAFAVKIEALNNYGNLADNTYYYWRVSALDGFAVEGDFSAGSENFIYYADGIELDVVQNITITTDGTNTQLSWDAVTQDLHGDPVTISHYNIYRSTQTDFAANAMTYLGNTTNTNFTDSSPVRSGQMFYVITAVVGLDNFNQEEGEISKAKK